jgi:membrane protein implicated in regulation of membrane protease activity
VLARLSSWGLAMGRHALGVYVLHLGLVALPVVVAGRMQAFTEPWQSNGYLLLTLMVCQAYAIVRTARQRRHREAAHAG